MQPTQAQMFYEAERKSGELNRLFMELVNDPIAPITRSELEKLIAKRPHIYGRFSNFLDKLR